MGGFFVLFLGFILLVVFFFFFSKIPSSKYKFICRLNTNFGNYLLSLQLIYCFINRLFVQGKGYL